MFPGSRILFAVRINAVHADALAERSGNQQVNVTEPGSRPNVLSVDACESLRLGHVDTLHLRQAGDAGACCEYAQTAAALQRVRPEYGKQGLGPTRLISPTSTL